MLTIEAKVSSYELLDTIKFVRYFFNMSSTDGVIRIRMKSKFVLTEQVFHKILE